MKKMIRYNIITGFLLVTSICLSQDLNFNIHKNKLADFIKLEAKAGGEKTGSKGNHISAKGIAQPLVYRRKEDKIPDLFVYYFYYEKDSVISYILYEWDEINTRGYGERAEKPKSEVRAYIEKYNGICAQLSGLYGIPKTKGNLEDLSVLNDQGLNREDSWKPNDSTSIELYTTLSGQHEKKSSYSISPTYRIRLYIRNDTKKQAYAPFPESYQKTLNANDSIFRCFIKELKQQHIEAAKAYLSDVIVGTVTNQQLVTLSQTIRLDEELVIFFKGLQKAGNGSSYLVFQYKYKSDRENPPAEIITVLFDDKGKIAGIHPKKKY